MADLTVLIPLDGSRQAEQALAFLTPLRVLPGLNVRLLSVAESDDSLTVQEEARREKLARDYLDDVTARTEANFGVPVDCVCRTGKAYEEVLEEASRDDVNLIVMTSHGRTITDPERIGSVADKVVRGATCPLLLIGAHASVPLQVKLITVPLDGSSLAAEALPVARSLAERLGSRLRLVRAVHVPAVDRDVVGALGADLIESQADTASLNLEEAKLELETTVPVETAVLNGPAAEALLSDIREHRPDLLIMTSHGRTGFIRWALGSVTDRMIRGPAPVLILRPQGEAGRRLSPLLERLGAG